MIILNLAEPLSAEDASAIAALAGRRLRGVQSFQPKFSDDLPLAPQVRNFVDLMGYSPKDWQTMSMVICLPQDPVAAALFVAEVAGRRGRTPTIVRFRTDANTGKREPSELISLHEVRKEAQQAQKGWIPPTSRRVNGE